MGGTGRYAKISTAEFPAHGAHRVLLSPGCSEELLKYRPAPWGLRAPAQSPQERMPSTSMTRPPFSLSIFSFFSLLFFCPFCPPPFPACPLPPTFFQPFIEKKRNIFNVLKKGLIFNVIDPPPPTPFPGCGTSGAERLELITFSVHSMLSPWSAQGP